MASFTAFLEVGGKKYPLFRYELAMHQETDTLGRPASPVLGGTITCTLSSPGSADPFLYQWMMSPTMQQDGKVRLLQDAPKATEKTISFFNAYCTHLEITFQPGQNGGAGSSIIQLQISSQRVAVGAIVHDNNWPLASHGSGETFTKQAQPPAKKAAAKEPSALSDAIHTTLDVVDMIPLLGEVADGANAAMYAAEGDYTNAALSAAAMVPLVGNVATGAKLGKRALKIVESATALKKAKIKRKTPRLSEHVVDPPFKRSKKHDDAEFERQLDGQEKGINDLTVDEYLNNRDKYLREGRAPEGSLAQKQAREKALRDKQAELRRQGKNKDDAKKEAEQWLDSQNALHNPDQIAGGHPEKIEGIGDAGVNKSIGSQWDKHKRAEKLDEHVRTQAENMSPRQRKRTKLNVKLPKINR